MEPVSVAQTSRHVLTFYQGWVRNGKGTIVPGTSSFFQGTKKELVPFFKKGTKKELVPFFKGTITKSNSSFNSSFSKSRSQTVKGESQIS